MSPREPIEWLRATYHVHVFHYRMPETAAINAVNPVIPSPLTVKMALLATALRRGDRQRAETLADLLPTCEVRIRPPAVAVTYRAFMRYVRPPGDGAKLDLGTGSRYTISPHFREYSLWGGDLEVYLAAPASAREMLVEALWDVPYLGAKDSQVTCRQVSPGEPPPDVATVVADLADISRPGLVVRLADWVSPPESLLQVIPGQRAKKQYSLTLFRLPGGVEARGATRVYRRGGTRGGKALV